FERGRRHLSACHPVYAIVYKNHKDVFTAVTGMQNFSGTNGGQIPIALIGKDKLIGVKPYNAGCNSRSPSMSSFLPVDVDVVICKYCTTHRCHANGIFL